MSGPWNYILSQNKKREKEKKIEHVAWWLAQTGGKKGQYRDWWMDGPLDEVWLNTYNDENIQLPAHSQDDKITHAESF